MTLHAAVILAAGQGTRMKSQLPKVLHRICGREMVGLVVDTAQRANLGPIVIVVPDRPAIIRDALGDSVIYAEQSQPLGTGHALLQARSALNGADNVVVLAGDVPLIQHDTLCKMLELHTQKQACVTLLTSTLTNPDGLGRIVRTASGEINAIVEESEADENILALSEINAGIYCFRTSWLWDALSSLGPSPKGEIFLTDLVSLAVNQGLLVECVRSQDAHETLGVNNRVQLAQAESVLRRRIREHWMMQGVTLIDPDSVYIDANVELGQDTVVLPNTHIINGSRIGKGCEIGPNSIVAESVIADNCRVTASVVEGAVLEDGVDIGPFSHMRPGAVLKKNVHIGNYVEVKNSTVGEDTKSGHFSYIGDATVGANTNIGAGTVTCNWDGEHHHRTTIGENVFIGCDTMLVAPVEIGDGSKTGAGAVVNKNVPPNTTVVGVPAKELKKKNGNQNN